MLHSQLRRFNILNLHRRFGKTVFAIAEMIIRGLSCTKKNPVCVYISPTFSQAKRIAWTYLKDQCRDLPNYSANEAELRVEIQRPDRNDKITFMLLGAENFDSIRGMYFDFCILDEYAIMNPEVWSSVIRPALSDRLGGLLCLSTPRGSNHFKSMYDHARDPKSENWFCATLKASETKIIPESELNEARATMGEEVYMAEYECAWTGALSAAYFGKEMVLAEKEKRITNVPYDKAKGVTTIWDIGISDSTAIWFFQEIGKEYRLFDYHEDSGVSLDSYVKVLKDKPYWYDEHLLPHDAAARELSTGKSREEFLREALRKSGQKGHRVTVLPRYGFDDTINAAKMILNKCWFDAERCRRGIECLQNYSRKWDSKNQIWSSKPNHDHWSHGADAFRMLATSYREEATRTKESDLQRSYDTNYDVFEY